MANTDTEKDTGSRILTRIGIVLIPMAILMPWIVVHFDLKSLGDFGAVGDFIGGTTVTFLTGASVFLLIATNRMQRKELQMSRQSIDEMVKQTEASVEQMKASVQQAEEAKKETQITNETMKRQQFETTFFNMINLHHNILKELRYNDKVGRDAISEFYAELKGIYINSIYREHKLSILKEGDIEKLNELTIQFLIAQRLSEYEKNIIEVHCNPLWVQGYYTHFDKEKFSELQAVRNAGNDELWNKFEDNLIKSFDRDIKDNREECIKVLDSYDLKWYGEQKKEIQIKHEFITKFENEYYVETLTSLKYSAYERLYKEHENVIGHYYRNLYRIVKLIQNNTFDSESHEQDNEEKRKYRGILRAQLSSFELLMLFYNISYSEKGKNFKKLIAGINFFDDHLIEEDFIWKNDVKELASLNASKGVTETNSI
ncbi:MULTISPECIES: putative phage abortive infection protein [unclassified Bacillus (in: firmicutes)]|uniref:putative phage abortive infection protein n=1 Tax=unclassified Bacillus (in: firmicutes) TaxID=185979 RepID=UPI0038378B68